ncbi:hypothetical protein ACFY0F_10550 [Streptomyces sp. NPDC001544]|uniref:hypothetical protein n=1 Tax=Streptomyces sp. NPDC001544 TaxID=3364584 RepID=UPI0036B0B7E5
MESSAGGRVPGTGRLKAGAGLLLTLLCLVLLCSGPAQAADRPAGASSTGTITIAVGLDRSRQLVMISETRRYTLAPHSKALASLRATGIIDGGTGYRLETDVGPRVYDGWSSRPTMVTQASPDEPARVEARWGWQYQALRSGAQHLWLLLTPHLLLQKRAPGSPTAWTVTVSAPQWHFSRVFGAVESQTPSTVAWRVTSGSASSEGKAAVTPSVMLDQSVQAKPLSRRHQTQGEMILALSLSVCGIGVVAAFVVSALAGGAVPRRWARGTLLLAVAVCPLAVWEAPGRSAAAFGFDPRGVSGIPPDAVWEPGPALGLWLWYLLPMAGLWFSRRLAEHRPPSPVVLLSCGASVVLPYGLMAAGGWRPTVFEGSVLAGSVLLALAVTGALCLARRGSAARRWAIATGTLVGVVPLLLLLSGSPVMAGRGGNPPTDWSVVGPVLILTWPAAAWLTSLRGPVLRRSPKPASQLVRFTLLWGMLTAPFLIGWGKEASRTLPALWEDYPTAFFTGYRGYPLCVMTVCGVILQIVYLRRRGAPGDGGRAVEPVGRVLLVCGALLALGSPSLRTLTMWGDSLGVTWTALGSLLLIPPGSIRTAAKFRRVTRKAHAGFMDRWVRTQLLWDTRADFQRAARSSLADDMAMSAFADRWRELDVPGRCGDPATRLARAKRFALGSSAGVAPRVAGPAGAALAQLLALPWAAYKLVTGSAVGADSSMPFHLGAISQTLRFGHWALYGFVFGYFYALLRGLTPIGKAGMLLLVVLPAEILPMVTLTVDSQYTQDPSWTDMAVACGALAGQTFVVCMGLGLCWEWWLARAAAMKWSQVRNFRRLSSVTVPAGTVLVAAATAFATVVAGTWAQQELVPPSQPPSSTDRPGQPAP